MALIRRRDKDGQGAVGDPLSHSTPVPSPRSSKSAFSRWFSSRAVAAATAIVLSITNINAGMPNLAYGKPPSGGSAGIMAPGPTLVSQTEAELRAKAQEAVSILVSFVSSGGNDSQGKFYSRYYAIFTDLVTKYNMADPIQKVAFYDTFKHAFENNSILFDFQSRYAADKGLLGADPLLIGTMLFDCIRMIAQGKRGDAEAQFGPNFVAKINQIIAVQSSPVLIDIRAKMSSGQLREINEFFQRMGLPACAPKDNVAMMQLVDATTSAFGLTDPIQATQFLNAVVYAYLWLKSGEKQSFEYWVSQLKADSKKAQELAQRAHYASKGPGQQSYEIFYSEYKKYYETPEAQIPKKVDQFEELKKRYPPHVQTSEMHLAKLTKIFETSPSGMVLQEIVNRFNFASEAVLVLGQDPSRKADLAKFKAELDPLSKWLDKFDLKKFMAEEAQARMEFLSALGMAKIDPRIVFEGYKTKQFAAIDELNTLIQNKRFADAREKLTEIKQDLNPLRDMLAKTPAAREWADKIGQHLTVIKTSISSASVTKKATDSLSSLRSNFNELSANAITIVLFGESQKPISEKLAAFKSCFMKIDSAYLLLGDPKRSQIFSLFGELEEIAGQKQLYNLVLAHLFALDQEVGEIFTNLAIADPDLIDKMKKRVDKTFSADQVRKGQEAWARDYHQIDVSPLLLDKNVQDLHTRVSSAVASGKEFKPGDLTTDEIVMLKKMYGDLPLEVQLRHFNNHFRPPSEVDNQRYAIAAALPPITAAAFFQYVKTVQENHVGSEYERRSVRDTIIFLNSVNPILVPKYLAAIKAVAESCANAPDTYSQSLDMIHAGTRTVAGLADPLNPINRGALIDVRRVIDELGDAFNYIRRSVASGNLIYDRLDLLDRTIYLLPQEPHYILHKPWALKPPLIAPGYGVPGGFYPSPFPRLLTLPAPIIPVTSGRANLSPGTIYTPESAAIVPTTIIPSLYINTFAASTVANARSWFYPTHTPVTISTAFPGSTIWFPSLTKFGLIIQDAFRPKRPLEYSAKPIGGGGQFGYAWGDNIPTIVGGVGSWVTTTGGVAAALNASSETGFGGLGIAGQPLGSKGGIRSASIGAEVTPSQANAIAKTLFSQYDPKNPKNIAFSATAEADRLPGGTKSTVTGVFSYTDRDIYLRVSGGHSDYYADLNSFVSFLLTGKYSTDETKAKVPLTAAANVENVLTESEKSGGSALAVDLGRTSVLLHFQELSSLYLSGYAAGGAQGQAAMAPTQYLWTGAFAPTVREVGKTSVYEFKFPGELLRFDRGMGTGTGAGQSDDYFIQDGVFTLMRRKTDGGITRLSEFTIGAGGGFYTTLPPTVPGMPPPTESVTHGAGRGGIHYKQETIWSDRTHTNWGLGASVEAGPADAQALQFAQAAFQRTYLQNLYKIGVYGYGSKRANELVYGALLSLIPQFTVDPQSGASFDAMKWLFIGFIAGARDIYGEDVFKRTQGARVEIQRYQAIDVIADNFNGLMSTYGNNPQQIQAFIQNFKNYYGVIDQFFDRYALAVSVSENFSLDFNMVAREVPVSGKGGDWYKQVPDNVSGRALLTFNRGFARAQAFFPLFPANPQLGGMAGAVGADLGLDLFNGPAFNRMIVGAAAILSRDQLGEQWKYKATLLQGGIVLYNNLVENYSSYKSLVAKYDRAAQYLDSPNKKIRGYIGKIDPELRAQLASGANPLIKSQKVRDLLLAADERTINLDESTLREIGVALGQLFEREKFAIQEKFNKSVKENLEIYTAARVLIDGDKMWDVGIFAQYVDRMKLYLIGGMRDQPQFFGGFDIKLVKRDNIEFNLGAIQGVRGKAGGGPPDAGFGAHFQLKFPQRTAGGRPGVSVHFAGGYSTQDSPTYSDILMQTYQYGGFAGGWGFITLSIGDVYRGATPMFINPGPTPYSPTQANPYQR
ncbi:hypothetical protein HY988_06365 [Candidatus Micrarchaeota archaeon]|nr:hypothetical protein [Candidatus Micrarchaeota archaeon]